ncbi:hypothetical protein [Bradyrhizobium sp.]|uniref:hypothetical protein n=1 Tax=Bradyrhizobium sp. TaxID=376 RepID=UPI003C38F8EB
MADDWRIVRPVDVNTGDAEAFPVAPLIDSDFDHRWALSSAHVVHIVTAWRLVNMTKPS